MDEADQMLEDSLLRPCLLFSFLLSVFHSGFNKIHVSTNTSTSRSNRKRTVYIRLFLQSNAVHSLVLSDWLVVCGQLISHNDLM